MLNVINDFKWINSIMYIIQTLFCRNIEGGKDNNHQQI